MLKGKKIVIGITGSIAAYKIPLLIRLLVREEALVRVIMTPSAVDFVTPLTLSTLSKANVVIDPFKESTGEWNNHVELGTWADAMVFAPVTANSLGKMANGIADNFLVTAYLSARCPVFIAPAMDLDMYNHPSTKKNIAALRSFGNIIIEPQTGELASGLSGPGRMEEPEEILNHLRFFFEKEEEFSGLRILVTAGPTYEPIDPVRFIGNRSSGLMGYSIADEAARRGAEVTLISGPTHLAKPHPGMHFHMVSSAEEMRMRCLECFPSADILIMAAAVADFTPTDPHSYKIRKKDAFTRIELSRTADILEDLGKVKNERQFMVGFALETSNGIDNAREKMKSKNLDMIVMNSLEDKGAGFDVSTNKITILAPDGISIEGALKDKKAVASDILDAISKLIPDITANRESKSQRK